ncbi:hypothetical protein GMORB2_0937 [Geosmithia morbida]|uniref:Uncharacterized protein n=1 Tax=Geosmithia morbida TaxID=1094350 RepID=A0A9P4YZ10_9HYPO|nr:uncharacterized protein GMORB2_0937 [Geosmithia morbida]KAF4125693.1 hypothetical protein GMORB2_0937 [Geosmithia morbida]
MSSAKEEVNATAAAAEVAEHVKPTENSPGEAALEADVPDPDEDDLDDLDDMLDEFSSVKLDTKKPSEAAPHPATAQPAQTEAKDDHTKKAESPFAGLGEDFSDEDFAKQLQAGMADLLGEFEKSPDMQSQFEEMFKQINASAGAEDASGAPGMRPSTTGTAAAKSASGAAADRPAASTDGSFQETIRRTMERMQNSGDQATAAAASSSEDDFMTEMLKQLSSGDFKGGEGGEEEFSKMLMGMMEQLTNKEILYEPMKELNEKFPEWLDKNRSETSAEDLKRYEEQRVLVAEIVAKFEETSYSDSSTAHREYIVDKMQKMQAAGSPPSDLVGDMESAQEAFNGSDEQCNPQ